MKKLLSLLLILLMSFAMVSCGSSSDSEESAEEPPKTIEANEAPAVGNAIYTYEDDTVRIDVTRYEIIQPGDTTYSETPSDVPVLAIWYTATSKPANELNNTPEGIWTNTLRVYLVDNADGNFIQGNDLAWAFYDPDDSLRDNKFKELEDGESAEACLGFEYTGKPLLVIIPAADDTAGVDESKYQVFDLSE